MGRGIYPSSDCLAWLWILLGGAGVCLGGTIEKRKDPYVGKGSVWCVQGRTLCPGGDLSLGKECRVGGEAAGLLGPDFFGNWLK